MPEQHEPDDQSASQQGLPGDPVQREIDRVQASMAAAREGVPAAGGAPAVPSEDEVAGLEQAHEALRTTLDRVDRGG